MSCYNLYALAVLNRYMSHKELFLATVRETRTAKFKSIALQQLSAER